MTQPWRLSHRADPRALPLADAHYNRQTIGALQFVPPGSCLVLLDEDATALWVTSWPKPEYVMHRWPGAFVCSLFRREPACPADASDLIVAACAATRARWPDIPDLGMVTFLDTRHVQPTISPDGKPFYGYTWRRAGFRPDGQTAGGLLAFRLRPGRFPDPRPARVMLGQFEFEETG